MENTDNINENIPEPTVPARRGRPPMSKTVETAKPSESITEKTETPKAVETVIPDGKVLIDADRLAKLEQSIDILRDAVKADRLEKSDEKYKGKKKLVQQGHLKVLRGKVIVAWLAPNARGSEAKQEIIYQNNIPVGEKMIGHYKTIDGEDIVCEMNEFTRSTEQEKFDIVSRNGDMITVRFHNPELPQVYELAKRYINPQ